MKLFLSSLFFCLCLTITGFSQLLSEKIFSNKNGFCSTTIVLDSLGNFFREAGCEGRSYIAYGRYILRNGIVEFRFASFDSLVVFKEIKKSLNTTNDSIISVQFLTNSKTPVSNNDFFIEAVDSTGKFLKEYRLNEAGTCSVNVKLYKKFRLTYLEKVLGRAILLPELKSNTIIVLNLPSMFFYYTRPRLDRSSVFSLRLKKDGLYELTGKEKIYDVIQ